MFSSVDFSRLRPFLILSMRLVMVLSMRLLLILSIDATASDFIDTLDVRVIGKNDDRRRL